MQLKKFYSPDPVLGGFPGVPVPDTFPFINLPDAPPPGVEPGVVVVGETPSGAVNGSNATFTSLSPFVPESVEVMINGLYQKRVRDFNTSGVQTIILSSSPNAGELILINYTKI